MVKTVVEEYALNELNRHMHPSEKDKNTLFQIKEVCFNNQLNFLGGLKFSLVCEEVGIEREIHFYYVPGEGLNIYDTMGCNKKLYCIKTTMDVAPRASIQELSDFLVGKEIVGIEKRQNGIVFMFYDGGLTIESSFEKKGLIFSGKDNNGEFSVHF